jgi:methionine-rich copper-binding protein CopC
LVVTLPALEPGAYTVHYTSSSADDGHPYSDSYTFTLEAASEVVPDCARLEA